MFLYNDTFYKSLRKDLRYRSTPAEKIVWSFLRNKQIFGFKFYRQYGALNYILDFYCPKLKLAIEIDGLYHNQTKMKLSDKFRDNSLESLGIQTIRFTNEEVLADSNHFSEKISSIVSELKNQHPS